METVTLEQAKQILGPDFIGPSELKKIDLQLNITADFKKLPPIPFSSDDLKKLAGKAILILGVAKNKNNQNLTLVKLRELFGVDPKMNEPCFYNQDWYLNEKFANKSLKPIWYIIGKEISNSTRGKDPEKLKADFPEAILTSFVFFAYYLLYKKILWRSDFLWCSDFDKNGDRIYTGRYKDPNKLSKNGFNIHRHLKIKQNYGAVNLY